MIRLTPQQAHAVLLADDAITWARFTSQQEIRHMNKHSLDYIDLHPEPVQQEEPSEVWIWLMAAMALVGACALVVIALGWTP